MCISPYPISGRLDLLHYTKKKISMKDFFSKCDQIRCFLPIWAHLLKKSLMENSIFFALLGLCLVPNITHFALSSLK